MKATPIFCFFKLISEQIQTYSYISKHVKVHLSFQNQSLSKLSSLNMKILFWCMILSCYLKSVPTDFIKCRHENDSKFLFFKLISEQIQTYSYISEHVQAHLSFHNQSLSRLSRVTMKNLFRCMILSCYLKSVPTGFIKCRHENDSIFCVSNLFLNRFKHIHIFLSTSKRICLFITSPCQS